VQATGGAIIAASADTAIPSASNAPRTDLANMPPSLDSPSDPSAAMADLTQRACKPAIDGPAGRAGVVGATPLLV
jgi:hypothetical protein